MTIFMAIKYDKYDVCSKDYEQMVGHKSKFSVILFTQTTWDSKYGWILQGYFIKVNNKLVYGILLK